MLRLCGGSGATAIGPPTLRLRASFAVSVAAASGCCCCFIVVVVVAAAAIACLERGNFFNVALFSDIIHMPGNCSSFRWGWEQLSFKSEKDHNEIWHS